MQDQRLEVYAAIEKHFRENYEQLVQRYRRYYQNQERAEDVVSEGFTRAIQYWDTYDPGKPIDKWLNRIMNNSAKDIARQEATHGMLNYAEEEDRSSPLPAIMLKQLKVEIAKKASPIKDILFMFFFEQEKPKVISRNIPVSPENVRKIVQRFRAEVKADYKWEI